MGFAKHFGLSKLSLSKNDLWFPSVDTLQVGVLNVVEAPDILYNETSNDTIVAEGASVTLRWEESFLEICSVKIFAEPIHNTLSKQKSMVGSVIQVTGTVGWNLKIV